jgi:hypothetical protein
MYKGPWDVSYLHLLREGAKCESSPENIVKKLQEIVKYL